MTIAANQRGIAGALTGLVLPALGFKCWGSNDYGQLGANQVVQSTTPVRVIGIP